jgi:hypothetical protein
MRFGARSRARAVAALNGAPPAPTAAAHLVVSTHSSSK